MADTQTTVITLDIQLLDAERKGATTIKLDNPRNNVTREMVSSAFQTALANEWFLTNGGLPVMYLGDITVNQSIKTKLGGEDFYVTPSTIDFHYGDWDLNSQATTTITVTGATIQGFNFTNKVGNNFDNVYWLRGVIADNGLSMQVIANLEDGAGSDFPAEEYTCDLELIILGTTVKVPMKISNNVPD